MKKIIAVLLTLTMMCGSIVTFAADGGKMETVLRDVKNRIGNTDQFDEFNSSESEYGGEVRYEFSWRTSDKENYRYMNVSVGENGIIYNYSFFDNGSYTEDEGLSIRKLSSDMAAMRADELINGLNPQLEGKLLIENPSRMESLYGDEYSFNIIHVENGYEIYGDSGYVSYNAKTDRLSNFYINYTENTNCDSVENAINADVAQEKYMESFGMRLYYMGKTNEDGTREYIPVYAPVQKPNKYINAISGEVEEIRTLPVRGVISGATTNDKVMMEGAADKEESRLTEAESAELEALEGLLSKNELIDIAKSNKYIEIPKDAVLSSYRLSSGNVYSGTADKYYASIEFTAKDESYARASFSLDAKTGEVISCSKYSEVDTDAELDVNKAEKLATEVAKSFAKEKLSEYKADEENTDKENGRFVYTRYVNDIPVDNDKINIVIGKDNKVSSYRISYSYNEFTSLDGIITDKEAGEALFKAVDYLMVYMPQMSSAESESYDIYVPVYIFDGGEPMIIDAKSGKQLNYSGEEYTPQGIAAYNDIDGHYAEEEILTLAKYGISFEGDSFRPDEKITQKDFMVLVNSAFGNSGAEPYPIAKRMGIIKNEEVDSSAEVSREMAAVFMVRALNIEEYASIEGIYVSPFKDVARNVGAISILAGIGVFNGDGNGNFNPNDKITRADSAIMIYNYLSR